MNQINSFYEEEDITTQFNSLVEVLNNGDIYFADGYNLYESMSATELFDKKVDMKLDLIEADTPFSLIGKGLIKPSEQLTDGEVLGLFDLVLGKEMLWYQGYALPQTIYTLVYQFDEKLTQQNQMIDTLFKSVNSINSTVYFIIKNAPYLREEDYIPSVFSFRSDTISLNELLQNHINPLDTQVNKKIKKSKQLSIIEGLSARIKIRKGIANLIQALSVPLSLESEKQIQTWIDFIQPRINIAKDTIKFAEDVSNYESKSIFKHIKAFIGQRVIPIITPQSSYDYLETMIQQIQTIIKISKEKNLFKLIDQVDSIVHLTPKNTLVRAYLEVNLFKFEPLTLFNSTLFTTYIKNFLNFIYPQYNEICDNKSPEVTQYFDLLTSITYEYVIKMLRGNFRQMRDFHKIYAHFSMLIHESTKLDEVFFQGNKSPLMIFSYEFALKMMIKQLTLGFELEIYDHYDLSYIYFYLEYFTTVVDKNRTNYLNTIPTAQLQALVNKQSGGKKKKSLTEVQEQIYYEMPYIKGINQLFKAYSRFFYILAELKLVQTPSPETFQQRYSNRLKIFETCYFIKPVSYQEFLNRIQEVYKGEEQIVSALDFVSDCFKEAQNNFKSISQDEKSVSEQILQQQTNLMKICIMNSLTVMKIKNNKDKISNLKISTSDKFQIPYLLSIDAV